jgi:hypothetical protein
LRIRISSDKYSITACCSRFIQPVSHKRMNLIGFIRRLQLDQVCSAITILRIPRDRTPSVPSKSPRSEFFYSTGTPPVFATNSTGDNCTSVF